jgi:hypothetical protein
MRLYEFDQTPDISIKLVALVDQLKNDIENQEIDTNMSVDQLLDYFQKYDIILDVTDLYDMIQNPPLNQVISNIQGDDVVFKGHDDVNFDPNQKSDQEKTVSQMAKRAMK